MRPFYFLHLLPCSTLLFTESEDKLVKFEGFFVVVNLKKKSQIYGNIYFKKKLNIEFLYSSRGSHT